MIGGKRSGPYHQVSDGTDELGAYEHGEKTGTWKRTVHGTPQSQQQWKAGRKDGTFITWEVDGSKDEQSFKDDQAEGVHRRWKAGQLVVEEHFTAGEKDGPQLEWYPSGTKQTELAFAKGTPIGAHAEWYENGKPSKQGTYVDGKLHGPWHEWNEDQKPLAEGRYAHGKMTGTWKRWRSDGSKLYAGEYVDDERRGTWTYFDTTDAVVATVVIGAGDEVEVDQTDDGQPKTIDVKAAKGPGMHLEFLSTGTLKVRAGIQGGEKEGPWVELDCKGNKVVELVYVHGKKHGPSASYHEDSKQLAEQGTIATSPT